MRIAYSLFLFAAIAQSTWGDTVELKDGRKITGKVLLYDGQQLRLSEGDKIDVFALSDLSSVRFGNDAPVTLVATPQPVTGATMMIPSGTVIAVRTIDAIDSQKASPGQTFRASLDEPVVVSGNTVAAPGADVALKLIGSKEAGKLTGRSELTISLTSVKIGDRIVDVNTESMTSAAAGKGKRTAMKAGGGAAAGAAIGAIFGGGLGAAVGAAAGGAAGTGVALMTKGPRVTIPPETRLSFTVR